MTVLNTVDCEPTSSTTIVSNTALTTTLLFQGETSIISPVVLEDNSWQLNIQNTSWIPMQRILYDLEEKGDLVWSLDLRHNHVRSGTNRAVKIV